MIGASLKMEIKVTCKDAYQSLAYAIVLQTVRDWRTAYRATKRSYGEYSRMSWGRVYKCEKFFRSAWFRALTNDNIDGELLIKQLRKEEDERWNRSHKQT